MGQNSDIHNIFESYSKKVLLKEQYTKEQISELEKRVNTITDPEQKKIMLGEIAKGKAAQSTVTKPVEVDGTKSNAGGISVGGITLPPNKQPAGTPTPQSNAGGISVGGLTLPPNKQPAAPTTPSNGGGTVTAKMPATSQDNAPMGLGNGISIGNPGNTQGTPSKPLEVGGGISIGKPGGTQGTPSTPQGSSASDIDNIKIPSDLGGGTIGKPGGTQGTPSTPLEVGGGISIGNPDAAQEAPAKTTGAGSNKKQSSSNNGSIVDYLAGKNQAFDKASRGELAAQYGIQNYTGTAQQNTDLLNKLRANEKMSQGTNATGEKQYAAGTVPKAPANEPQQQQPQQQPQQQQGMGGIVGGVSKLAGGAGNLAKKALIGDQPLGGIVGGVSKLAGGAGNLFKKALIGGGQQQPAAQQAPVQQQAAPAPTNQAAPVKKSPTKQQTPPVKTTGLAADKYIEDEEIQENRNIAKFVKCLSEKNYSQAHEYLKKIVNFKVEKNLSKVINKI